MEVDAAAAARPDHGGSSSDAASPPDPCPPSLQKIAQDEKRYAPITEPPLEPVTMAVPTIVPRAPGERRADLWPLPVPSNAGPPSPRTRSPYDQAKRITLNEVTGSPIEDEAETAIIRALEARDWEGACDRDADQDVKFREALKVAVRSRHNLPENGSREGELLSDAAEDDNVPGTQENVRIGEGAVLPFDVSADDKVRMDLDTKSRWKQVRLAVNSAAHINAVAAQGAADGDGGDDVLKAGREADDLSGGVGGQGEADMPTASTKGSALMRFAKDAENIAEDASAADIHFKFYKFALIYVIIPVLILSAILFYAAGNPIPDANGDQSIGASYSWWFNFGVRQVLTLSLSRLTHLVVIEILALRTLTFPRLIGPLPTLALILSRGWPFTLTFWAVWDFAILQGNTRFSRHWLHYSGIAWFADCEPDTITGGCNPAGNVVNSENYFRMLCSCIVVGVSISLKRVGMALYQGKRSCGRYGSQLEKLTLKMTLVSHVAHLAEEIEEQHIGSHMAQFMSLPTSPENSWDKLKLLKKHGSLSHQRDKKVDENAEFNYGEEDNDDYDYDESSDESDGDGVENDEPTDVRKNVIRSLQDGTYFSHQVRIGLDHTERMKLLELLGEWEEPAPTPMSGKRLQAITIEDVLHFRQAVLCLDARHPFSFDFGPASTREQCIESSQKVYDRLLLHTPEKSKLPFETIALITLMPNNEIDKKKARRLMRLFRPDRHGYLSALDFVKSCDAVYKELRTLRAGIANSSQIDRAFEQIVNLAFGLFTFCVALAIWKIDPLKLLMSMSSFLVSFSFLIKNASSKWIEGILLVLVQHPYDIGDKIAVSNPQKDTKPTGSSGWFVEKVTLFYTTVRFGTTNEIATYSNGYLASSRIINAARSPKANVAIYNKFPAAVPYERVMIFKSTIESFVMERPREWLAMNAFRATRFEADLGFIEYVIVLQHAGGWQNTGAILNSKAELSSYCLEVQKMLGMRYIAPPLPVNLDYGDVEASELADMLTQLDGKR